MSQPSTLAVEALRARHYNAEVVEVQRLHHELLILRVRLDAGRLPFVAGQYTVLGLGAWEPRVAGSQEPPLEERRLRQLVKRAYSISGTLIDAEGRLVPATDDSELEFYLTLVPETLAHAPALTPRLFALRPGNRLFVSPQARGEFTLAEVREDQNVVLVSTGTGEAPHNAMVSELLRREHRGQIRAVCCVRFRHDLGYLLKHHQLESRHENYRYFTLTTREPENLEVGHPSYLGKQYVQEYFESGAFERAAGVTLDPSDTHVYLCGNPAMIGGVPRHGARSPDQPNGMIEVLQLRGFRIDTPDEAGNIHYEKYW